MFLFLLLKNRHVPPWLWSNRQLFERFARICPKERDRGGLGVGYEPQKICFLGYSSMFVLYI